GYRFHADKPRFRVCYCVSYTFLGDWKNAPAEENGGPFAAPGGEEFWVPSRPIETVRFHERRGTLAARGFRQDRPLHLGAARAAPRRYGPPCRKAVPGR